MKGLLIMIAIALFMSLFGGILIANAEELKIIIPDDKVSRVVEAFRGRYEGGEEYTDKQWVKKCIKDFIVSIVQRHEVDKAIRDIDIPHDEDLVE